MENVDDDNRVFLQVLNTKFWVVGEMKSGVLWDIWLIDSETNQKEILRQNTSITAFSVFTNMVLKTKLPI